jgi:hypothetical protein
MAGGVAKDIVLFRSAAIPIPEIQRREMVDSRRDEQETKNGIPRCVQTKD